VVSVAITLRGVVIVAEGDVGLVRTVVGIRRGDIFAGYRANQSADSVIIKIVSETGCVFNQSNAHRHDDRFDKGDVIGSRSAGHRTVDRNNGETLDLRNRRLDTLDNSDEVLRRGRLKYDRLAEGDSCGHRVDRFRPGDFRVDVNGISLRYDSVRLIRP